MKILLIGLISFVLASCGSLRGVDRIESVKVAVAKTPLNLTSPTPIETMETMWEMISEMATNRLWIYTALVGSLFGLAFSTYFKSTRIGLWMYAKFDLILDYLVERWGLTWLEQPTDAWRKKYPYVTKKIDELEKRIKKLEKK